VNWGAISTTNAALAVTAGLCASLGAGPAAYSVTGANLKGAEVRCDNANGWWPTQGWEGTALCADGTDAFGPYPVPNPTISDFFFAGALSALDFANAGNAGVMATEFSGPNQLLCAQGCVLPTSICNNGLIHANIIGDANGFVQATCTLRANRPGVMDTSMNFVCFSGLGTSPAFTATCPGGVPAVTTYAGQCGAADGAASNPLWNRNGNLNRWATTQTQNANSINGFAAVTSTLSQAYAVTTGAYATVRNWNANAFQAMRSGAVYNIAITGCSTLVGTARGNCVQRTLNWWRCYYNYPFESGTVCFADSIWTACPAPELGFACPSSSKKGLLGLLGLLGLIPLFLILCCLLLLCCIRRRKTEADVHFATFDPAAGMMGTASVAPMCTGSFAPATMPVM